MPAEDHGKVEMRGSGTLLVPNRNAAPRTVCSFWFASGLRLQDAEVRKLVRCSWIASHVRYAWVSDVCFKLPEVGSAWVCVIQERKAGNYSNQEIMLVVLL